MELNADQKLRLVKAHRNLLQKQIADDSLKVKAKESAVELVDAEKALQAEGTLIAKELGLTGAASFDLDALTVKQG